MKMKRRVLRVNMMFLVWAFQIWLIATAHAGVVSTSPASNAVNVATSIATINVEFDDDAYANYVTEGSFIVKPLTGFDPPAVSGVKSYGNRTATFTLSESLQADTEYSVSVTPDAFQPGVSWTFSTGAGGAHVAPIGSTNPAANATGVAVDTTISATFTDDSYQNIVTDGSFVVRPTGGFDPPIAGQVTYNSRTATFTPSASLEIDVTYIASVTPGDMETGYSWSFTTGAGEVVAGGIPLHAGWNLISFPANRCYYLASAGQPTVSMIDGIEYVSVDGIGDILTSIDGRYSYVQGFDSTGAKTYNLTPFSNMQYMAAGYGYWIKVNDDVSGLIYLEIEGDPVPATASIPLQSGWNLVGYLGGSVQYVDAEPAVHFPDNRTMSPVADIPSIFNSIAGQYSYVQGFDETGAKTYNLTPFSNFKYVGPGYGYWIKVNEGASPALRWE